MKGRGEKIAAQVQESGSKREHRGQAPRGGPGPGDKTPGVREGPAQQPLPVPIPVSRVLSSMGCLFWDVGLKGLGLERGYRGGHCRALEEGTQGHSRGFLGGNPEREPKGM